jgi:hypothetical protein
MGGPIEDILKETVYECVENRTILAEYFAKHLLLQSICCCKAFVAAKHLLLQIVTHEINDG